MSSTARSAFFALCLLLGCGSSTEPTDPGGDGDSGDGDTGDGDGDTGDGDGDTDDGDGDTGDGDTGDGDTGDGDTGDGDTGDGDTGDGDTGDGDTGDGDTGDGDTGDGDTGDGDTGDGDTGDGDTGDGDTGDGDTGDGDSMPPLMDGYSWATLTTYESYCTTQSECEDHSGNEYAGLFKAFPHEMKSLDWVMSNNIAAVHLEDYGDYEFKTIEVVSATKTIEVTIYDACSDEDCEGCCTENKEAAAQVNPDGQGFLLDLEKFTFEQLETDADFVQWRCIDC